MIVLAIIGAITVTCCLYLMTMTLNDEWKCYRSIKNQDRAEKEYQIQCRNNVLSAFGFWLIVAGIWWFTIGHHIKIGWK